MRRFGNVGWMEFVLATTLWSVGSLAATLDTSSVHDKFVEAFNARQWGTLKGILADDIVFHRANAKEVFVGPDAVLQFFGKTLAVPDTNVKFAVLKSTDQFTGKDGRVVERGDFAVTAGADDRSCYRGSYLMTWVPQSGGDWKLQMLAWQDLETERANCK